MGQHIAYAIGKYGEAYYSLAIGPQEISKRLIVAAGKLLAIRPDMVPDEVSSDVKWINDQFSKKDTIENSIRGRHSQTCVKIAERIVYVYSKLKKLNATDCNLVDQRNQSSVDIEINY